MEIQQLIDAVKEEDIELLRQFVAEQESKKRDSDDQRKTQISKGCN